MVLSIIFIEAHAIKYTHGHPTVPGGSRIHSIIQILCDQRPANYYHSAGKHDRGPLFFTLFSFRLIRIRSAGSI